MCAQNVNVCSKCECVQRSDGVLKVWVYVLTDVGICAQRCDVFRGVMVCSRCGYMCLGT
jgi:hypothetical protein